MSTRFVKQNKKPDHKKGFTKSQPVLSEKAKEIFAQFSTVSNVKETNNEVVDILTEGVNVKENLKAPVCCVAGHVDAGKTSLLDKLRNSNIQGKEAGGITQHIGSTFFPIEEIKKSTSDIKGKYMVEYNLPGVLMIDTPGHSEFQSLRNVGVGICDIGILIIDINGGVQEQTKEAIKLFKQKKTPFVIAVTKLDRIYKWVPTKESSLAKAFMQQSRETINYIEGKMADIIYDLAKEDIEAEFYFKNKKPEKIYSIVPISSKTGEGLADLMALLVYISQTWMIKKLTYDDNIKCTIMEAKKDEKFGFTIDVIINNGTLKIGDKFAISTLEGPKITTVRNILAPASLTQLGKKTQWETRDEVKGALGVKIIGSNLEGVFSGTHFHPIQKNEELALIAAKNEIDNVWKSFDFKPNGVYLGTETFGELDAGYSIFTKANINVANGFIGQPSSKYIDKIASQIEGEQLLENKMYLFFGKLEDEEIIEYANNLGVIIKTSEIIYDLIEIYNKQKKIAIKERESISPAVFPVELSIIEKFVFLRGGSSEQLMFGVKVNSGTLYKNTPIIVVDKNIVLGKVISIQFDHKEIEKAIEGTEVCIKLDNSEGYSYNRHFEASDKLISHLTRESIDILKRDYKESVSNNDWSLIIKHMKLLGIKSNV
jgi:translation initiation factor 5B